MIHFEVNFCEARDKLLVLNLNDVLFKKADRTDTGVQNIEHDGHKMKMDIRYIIGITLDWGST